MTRRREQQAIANIDGIIHVAKGTTKRHSQVDLLAAIQKLAIDARDLIAIKDPEEQRFWTAAVVFSQSAEVRTRKVGGVDQPFVRQLDPVMYHWSLCEILRLLPHMLMLSDNAPIGAKK